ncbi:hypothetical protein BROUX41_004825 [Berkeleyomyces rouxiae]
MTASVPIYSQGPAFMPPTAIANMAPSAADYQWDMDTHHLSAPSPWATGSTAGSYSSSSYTSSSPSSPSNHGFLMSSPDMSASHHSWPEPGLANSAMVNPAPVDMTDSMYLPGSCVAPNAAFLNSCYMHMQLEMDSMADLAWNDGFSLHHTHPTLPIEAPDSYVGFIPQHDSMDACARTPPPRVPSDFPVSSSTSVFPPSSLSPTTMAAAASSAIGSSLTGFCCNIHGCKRRIFKRKADLERHMRHVHLPVSDRKSFYCDYPRCNRAKHDAPFHRRDHLRDHYRDYHKDEVVKQGAVPAAAAAAAAGTEPVDARRDWWRCAKCLYRRNNKHADCVECKTPKPKARRSSAICKR